MWIGDIHRHRNVWGILNVIDIYSIKWIILYVWILSVIPICLCPYSEKQTVLLWTDMFPFVAFSHVGLLKTSCTFWRSDFSLWGLVPHTVYQGSAHGPHWGVPSNRPKSFSNRADISMILMLMLMTIMKFAPSRYRVLLPMRPVSYQLLQTIMLVTLSRRTVSEQSQSMNNFRFRFPRMALGNHRNILTG